jgi:coenzyme F420-0:L-glutamate ligase / coenzyme F420-1:gamma-L-glutamate ligase
MSDVTEAIQKRRSIREYQSRSVPYSAVKEILDGARCAPSAHNAQPWRFVVISDINAKQVLAEAMAAAWLRDLERDGVPAKSRTELVKKSKERISQVPVLIMACLTLENMVKFPDEERRRNERDLAIQSLAAAMQNMLLTAYLKGLGACWYCSPIFCKTAVQDALKLPLGIEPQGLMTIGYPAETPKVMQRKPLHEIAYLNSWGNPL